MSHAAHHAPGGSDPVEAPFTWRRKLAFFCLGLCLGVIVDLIVRWVA